MAADNDALAVDHIAEIWKIIGNGVRPGRALMEEVRELIAETLIVDATLHAREIDLSGCHQLGTRFPDPDVPTIAAS